MPPIKVYTYDNYRRASFSHPIWIKNQITGERFKSTLVFNFNLYRHKMIKNIDGSVSIESVDVGKCFMAHTAAHYAAKEDAVNRAKKTISDLMTR